MKGEEALGHTLPTPRKGRANTHFPLTTINKFLGFMYVLVLVFWEAYAYREINVLKISWGNFLWRIKRRSKSSREGKPLAHNASAVTEKRKGRRLEGGTLRTLARPMGNPGARFFIRSPALGRDDIALSSLTQEQARDTQGQHISTWKMPQDPKVQQLEAVS